MTRKDLNKSALFQGNTLRSIERIKSEKVITELFNQANVVTFLCLRCHWKVIPNIDFPVQMAVSVAKKKLKHAVDRNTVKRRVREAYRVQKHPLYQIASDKSLNIALMFIYLPIKWKIPKSFANPLKK
ncbi:MAG: ribonuclease P protein component [Bacteroidetes bacterium]|nr:ribonuclease P protein component [Bacteroidota bacterium]